LHPLVVVSVTWITVASDEERVVVLLDLVDVDLAAFCTNLVRQVAQVVLLLLPLERPPDTVFEVLTGAVGLGAGNLDMWADAGKAGVAIVAAVVVVVASSWLLVSGKVAGRADAVRATLLGSHPLADVAKIRVVVEVLVAAAVEGAVVVVAVAVVVFIAGDVFWRAYAVKAGVVVVEGGKTMQWAMMGGSMSVFM
jgi:hypothetical protein